MTVLSGKNSTGGDLGTVLELFFRSVHGLVRLIIIFVWAVMVRSGAVVWKSKIGPVNSPEKTQEGLTY